MREEVGHRERLLHRLSKKKNTFYLPYGTIRLDEIIYNLVVFLKLYLFTNNYTRTFFVDICMFNKLHFENICDVRNRFCNKLEKSRKLPLR